jgi:hypothetical protein
MYKTIIQQYKAVFHMKFSKQSLQVRTQTSNVTLYGKFGRLPIYVMRKIRIIKYLFKIMSNTVSLMYKLFMKHIFNGYPVTKWSKNVKNILDETVLFCTS